jgi:hypothetical protein
MGKAGFLSFFVVLAEISSGVKEFFRNDGAMMRMVYPQKKMGFARGTGSCRPFLQGIFERTARGKALTSRNPCDPKASPGPLSTWLVKLFENCG